MAENFTPKEIEDIITEYNYNIANGIPISAELNTAMKDAAAGVKDYTRNLKASKDALVGSLKSLGMAMVNGESGAAVYNDAIDKGAKAFSSWNKGAKDGSNKLGTLAEWAAKAENAIAKQADALFQSYQDISRSGIALGMDDAFKNLESAGYTMKEIGQYGQLMKENSQVLATLGGTTADGAKKFAQASKNIKNSGLETQFMRMGMTVNDINGGIANYVKQQQLSGSTQVQNDKQIAASAAEFIVQQDKMTKLTGLSADQQNKVYEQALAQEQFAAHTFQLQQIAAKNKGTEAGARAEAELARDREVIAMAGKVGPDFLKNTQLYLSGAVNSKGYQQLQRGYSTFANYLDKGGADIGVATDLANKDAKNNMSAQSNLYRFGFGEALYGSAAEKNKQAAASVTDFTKANKTATDQIKKQAAGGDPLVKNMVDITSDQRDITQSADHVLNKGVEPVTKGLSMLSGATEELTGVFGQLAGKEGKIGGGPTLIDRAKSMFGGGGGGTPAPAAPGGGSGAPAPTAPSSPGANEQPASGGGGAGGAQPDLSSISTQGHSAQVGKPYAASFQRLLDSLDKAGYKINSLGGYVDRDVRGQPGKKSVHALGGAIDINPAANPLGGSLVTDMPANVSQMAASAGLGWGGNWRSRKDAMHFSAAASEGGSLIPQAAMGGILSGPKSGFQAMLHGNEAVVPLPDGKTIPVQMNGGGGSSPGQIKLLSAELDKLESMLRVMNKQNDITSKILAKQS